MKYCILIPTVNRKDLLEQALWYYSTFISDVNVLVLDNGKQNIDGNQYPNVFVYETNENLGVARSWNWLINHACFLDYQYFLVLNDDIILRKSSDTIKGIFSKYGQVTMHIPRPFYNMSAFMLTKHIWDTVGEFDPNFRKAFFEDNDYKYRVKLAGLTIRYEDELNADVYKNSQTIEKDPLLGGYIENREYYINKWGGLPDEEQYKTPFNAQ